MKMGVVLVAVFLVVAGAIATRLNGGEKTGETLSLEAESQEPSISSPTQIPTATSSPAPTNSPTSLPSPLIGTSAFIYPGARIIASSDSSATLESTENPDKITDWYKEKIKSWGGNVTSFVVTKTNDNVLNKLVGSNGKGEVKVEIKKDSGSSVVKIIVGFDG